MSPSCKLPFTHKDSEIQRMLQSSVHKRVFYSLLQPKTISPITLSLALLCFFGRCKFLQEKIWKRIHNYALFELGKVLSRTIEMEYSSLNSALVFILKSDSYFIMCKK